MNTTKICAGTYQYRSCDITLDHDNDDYQGWWKLTDPDDPSGEGDYWPTLRAAKAAIDADPPA